MVLDRFVKNGLVSYTALKANPRDLTLYLDAVDELSEQELQSWILSIGRRSRARFLRWRELWKRRIQRPRPEILRS